MRGIEDGQDIAVAVLEMRWDALRRLCDVLASLGEDVYGRCADCGAGLSKCRHADDHDATARACSLRPETPPPAGNKPAHAPVDTGEGTRCGRSCGEEKR